MKDFNSRCGGLVDAVFNSTCDKFEYLIRNFELNQMQNRWIVEQSSNNTLSGIIGINLNNSNSMGMGVVPEAPHIDLERASLHKQYIVFLSHVMTQECQTVLLSQTNQHRLESLLGHLLRAVQGDGIVVQLNLNSWWVHL